MSRLEKIEKILLLFLSSFSIGMSIKHFGILDKIVKVPFFPNIIDVVVIFIMSVIVLCGCVWKIIKSIP